MYGTRAGLPHGHLYGASTLSKDKSALYLMYFDRPRAEITVKGIRNPVKSVTVLGKNAPLSFRKVGGAYWVNVPGVLHIGLPEEHLDPLATVLKVELDGPLDLYHGSGQAVSVNPG